MGHLVKIGICMGLLTNFTVHFPTETKLEYPPPRDCNPNCLESCPHFLVQLIIPTLNVNLQVVCVKLISSMALLQTQYYTIMKFKIDI